MNAENLHSLVRGERMMVGWICGVSVKVRKNKKRSEDLYTLLGKFRASGVARAPQTPWSRGPMGLKGPPGARQEEVVTVTPCPEAQTSCFAGGENRRYATVQSVADVVSSATRV